MTHASQVCMSDLLPYMTSSSIINAFQSFGHYPVSAHISKKKKDDKEICILQFPNDDAAKQAVFKLNGVMIPQSGYTGVPVKFKLSQCIGSKLSEYSVWVGDLTQDVTDYILFKFFSSSYKSLFNAKIIFDSRGVTKGYGFLKFSDEDDMKHCIRKMHGVKGLTGRPIKVAPETRTHSHHSGSQHFLGNVPSEIMDNSADPWRIYLSWNQSDGLLEYPFIRSKFVLAEKKIIKIGESKLVDHQTNINCDDLNAEIIERDCYLWDALECSKWLPEGLLSMNNTAKM